MGRLLLVDHFRGRNTASGHCASLTMSQVDLLWALGHFRTPCGVAQLNRSGMWPRSCSGMWPLRRQWSRLRKGSLSGDFARDCAPPSATQSPGSACDRLPQAAGRPGSRSVRGRQHLTEGVVQFAAADLALERLVTALEVLPLLGVDEAGSTLRREELNAC